MGHVLRQEGIASEWDLDSAGIIGVHAGSSPDSRMAAAGRKRGLNIRGRARQVKPVDLDRFDLVLAMDQENRRDLLALSRGAAQTSRIRLFGEFCEQDPQEEVPDPYYGGDDGFELVLERLEDGCSGILKQWRMGTLVGKE